ncbi:MAG: hypothetical protein ABIV11_10200 [Gemmatimonadaceae bacterium]
MQDRYFGDIGDFAKYGLLRGICADDPEWRLCVLWYLVPDESQTNDGRHVAYLEPTPRNLKAFSACDPVLFDNLGQLVRAGKRSVSAVAENSLLPRQTVYHDHPLTYRGIRNGDRKAHRERWLATAHQVACEAAMVFLDPDNGLEVGTDRHDTEGPKYAFYDDLTPLSQAGKTIVIYQHANRDGSFPEQIQRRFSALRRRLGRPAETLVALRWRRISPRAFIFVLADGHAVLHERLRALLTGPWGANFELVRPTA